MLTLLVLFLAIACFGARFIAADGRATAAGGILLAVAVLLLIGGVILSPR